MCDGETWTDTVCDGERLCVTERHGVGWRDMVCNGERLCVTERHGVPGCCAEM